MKKLIVLSLFSILAFSLSVGIVADANGHKEKAQMCYAVAFTTLAIPAVQTMRFGLTLGYINKTFFQSNDQPYSRAELALMQHLARHGKGQTQADAAAGKLKLRSYMRTFRFEIADAFSGNKELLNAATLYVDGVIPEEWNNGKLPAGWNIAISHIGVGFVADGAVTTPVAAIALASVVNSWPAILRNGKLRFSQANNVKEEVDAAFCGTLATSTGKFGEDDALELQAPFILEEEKSTKFELLGAGAQAFASPAGGNFLEIRLFGSVSLPRA